MLILGGASDDKRNRNSRLCYRSHEKVSMDEFIDEFIAFIEKNEWSFGGGYKTIIDGYYMNGDGTRGKSILDE